MCGAGAGSGRGVTHSFDEACPYCQASGTLQGNRCPFCEGEGSTSPNLLRWARRFLRLAREVSTWSKDPSTQCGAVIVRPDRSICSLGYNGFPRGFRDDTALYTDREIKYDRVVHAEMNAILSAREPLRGYVLFTYPFMPCSRCAVHVAQAGLAEVWAPRCPEAKQERYREVFERSRAWLREGGVRLRELETIDDQ